MSDTPETDGKYGTKSKSGTFVDMDFARKLEHQRNSARAELILWKEDAERLAVCVERCRDGMRVGFKAGVDDNIFNHNLTLHEQLVKGVK